MAQRLLRTSVLGMLTVALLLTVGPYTSPAHAATFAVTTTADAPDTLPLDGVCATSAGTCTLRAAVQTANALRGGPHTINLSAAGTYLLTVTGPGEDAAATGDLDLNNVNVSFANTSGGTVAIDGNGADRVFDVGPTLAAQLALSAVTVQNGSEYEGGGIRVRTASTLTLTTSTVSGNGAGGESYGSGGGIYNDGTATLTRSTVSGNGASAVGDGAFASGGGIANHGTLELTDSTVSGNTAWAFSLNNCCFSAAGGGIANYGTLTVKNSTLSGNSAQANDCCFTSASGGGIANGGTLTLTSSTLSGNSAYTGVCCGGGGISGGAIAQSTILANTDTNCAGVLTSRGDNLSNDASCFDNDTTLNDRKDTDPLLGPLGSYGGPTKTHSLLAGSPAIDRVLHTSCPATDQRGVRRPVGDHCDIGAFESEATPPPSTTPTPTATPLSTLTPTATTTSTATATAIGTPTSTATSTGTPMATGTATPTSTATPTATGTATPTATRTSTPTATPTATPCTEFRGNSRRCR